MATDRKKKGQVRPGRFLSTIKWMDRSEKGIAPQPEKGNKRAPNPQKSLTNSPVCFVGRLPEVNQKKGGGPEAGKIRIDKE